MKYHETRVKVRFCEVDSYQVAWHGHYVAWMEAGRNDLTGKFGLDADQISALGYLAPVVALELQFRKPARFNEELTVRTSARRANTATLEFVCTIVDANGDKCAEGKTVHALIDKNGVIQYRLPSALVDRFEKLMNFLDI